MKIFIKKSKIYLVYRRLPLPGMKLVSIYRSYKSMESWASIIFFDF